MNADQPDLRTETPLSSWKEIAAYLQRNVATVRRWEKGEGLPVHRHAHQSRASVYAYSSEIDAWRASRKMAPEPEPARPLWKMPAFALTMALCLVMVGNGIRPQTASAQAPAARQVWDRGGLGQVSADGRYIVFPEWDRGIGIHDLVTGADRIQPTSEVGYPSVISADNSQVAYQYFDSRLGRYAVRLLALQGADQRPRNLMRGNPPEYAEPMGWTPDGKEVLVVQEQTDGIWQIAMVSVSDGTTRVLKSLKWTNVLARISPDGRFIAYDLPHDGQSALRDIFVLATDGTREAAVVQHPANDYGMIWSSDGSKILFLSDRTGATPSLWAVPMSDGKPAGPAELVKSGFGSRLLGMGPNETLYYAVSGRDRQNVYSVELDSDGKALKRPVVATDGWVNANHGGDISPDGQSIVYYSNRAERTVVVRNLKTGEERAVPVNLTMGSSYFQGPKWFADGRSVLVQAHTLDERSKDLYYRLDVGTAQAEVVLTAPREPLVAPDRIGNAVYSRIDGSRILRNDLDTGKSTDLAVVKNGLRITEFAVSRDGKQIAYTANSLEPGQEVRYLAVVPVAGGEPRELHRSRRSNGPSRFNALEWTRDGKYLLFVEEEGNGSAIWRVPAAGGAVERIGITMNGQIKSPFIHPDAKSIVFTAVEAFNNEVWALENFLPVAAK